MRLTAEITMPLPYITAHVKWELERWALKPLKNWAIIQQTKIVIHGLKNPFYLRQMREGVILKINTSGGK